MSQRRFITEDREVSAEETKARLEKDLDHAWATFLEARQDHDDAMKAYVAHLRNPNPSVERVKVEVFPGDPRYDSAKPAYCAEEMRGDFKWIETRRESFSVKKDDSFSGLGLVRIPTEFENDLTYQRWKDEYTGITDDGEIMPIEFVAPGAFVHSEPVGYMAVASADEAKQAWNWTWANP